MTTDSDVPGIDLAALRRRLAEPLHCSADSLRVELIAGGRSNLTYQLSSGDRRWVLRRQPLGHVLATAHDMHREYRVMSALSIAGLPVPRTLLYEADSDVTGAPFFVADYVEGVVVRTEADAAALAPDAAERAADDLVAQLAALHRLDPTEVGLGDLGRPTGFLERQLRRWRRQWNASGGGDTGLPLDRLATELAATRPPAGPPGIVHGDYRLDNTILSSFEPGRIAAIVDWEMATIGDPLADVGMLLTYWDPISAGVTGSGHPITVNRGFPGADHLVARYGAQIGRRVDNVDWYVAFGHFKLAVIAQTIEARYRQGLTVGARFGSAGEAVAALIDQGCRIVGRYASEWGPHRVD